MNKIFFQKIYNNFYRLHSSIYTFSSEQNKKGIPNYNNPSSRFKKNILITAALPYINNQPHLGNIIGALLSADVYARFCRLRGYNTLFISGTDQFGTASQVKAIQAKTSPQQLCDKYHQIHKQIYKWFQISTDFFGRTTSNKHKQIVQQIFTKLDQNGKIVEQQMINFYCNSCQMALADRFVNGTCNYCNFQKARGDQCDNCSKIFNHPTQQLKNPTCSVCKKTPEAKKSKHLFLNLKELQNNLKNWLLQENNNGMKQWTHNAKGITLAWIRDLKNRCITRDLKWGVSLPQYKKGYQNKKLYVWFDAPIGYISMTADLLGQNYKKWWINNDANVQLVQFMGKDNTVFHSIIFPAVLMGTNQTYIKPKKLCVTEYLNYEKGKFSKSRGTGVFGNDCVKIGFDSSIWRFYLCSNRPQKFDTEFTWEDFAAKNNKQLLNSIGNLYQRVLKYTFKQLQGSIQGISLKDLSIQQLKLIDSFETKVLQYVNNMQKVEIKEGIANLLSIASILNKYLQDSQFWKYKKLKNKQQGIIRKDIIIIRTAIQLLSIYSVLISPIMPKIAQLTLQDLNYNKSFDLESIEEIHKLILDGISTPINIKEPQLLFKQITDQQVNQWTVQYSKKQQM